MGALPICRPFVAGSIGRCSNPVIASDGLFSEYWFGIRWEEPNARTFCACRSGLCVCAVGGSKVSDRRVLAPLHDDVSSGPGGKAEIGRASCRERGCQYG